ncbi:MAG: iron-containing redox enzyme family protein [Myxococcaceae bacterium]|nr:iron-containing redox enzyme family protein [Myxococcaceae bacterium]
MLSREVREQMKQYAHAHCFRKTAQWMQRNAWHRPLAFGEEQLEQAHALHDFADVTTPNAYLLNKFLHTLHEQSGVFLPHMNINPICRRDYEAYFARERLAQGLALRIPLEDAVFGFLENGIEVREWTAPGLLETLKQAVAEEDRAPLGLSELLRQVKHKKEAIRLYLLHKASDFLTEGAAMTGSLGGSSGPLQCSLLRVFMDEYGNGSLERKHSSLFKQAMASCGLETYPHCYLEDYLPSSLMMANYFHFICKSPRHFFQYLGAMYFAEATTTCFFEKLTAAFKEALGTEKMDLSYFEEHIQVDQRHREIVLQELIIPAIEAYGDSILQEIYVGFECFRRLAGCAAADLAGQIRFADDVLGGRQPPEPSAAQPARHLVLHGGNRAFFPRIAETALHLELQRGSLEFGVGTGGFVTLRPGTRVAIPQGRLFRMRPEQGQDCELRSLPLS